MRNSRQISCQSRDRSRRRHAFVWPIRPYENTEALFLLVESWEKSSLDRWRHCLPLLVSLQKRNRTDQEESRRQPAMAIRATGPRAYQFLSPSYGVSRTHGLALSALIRLPARDFFAAPTLRIDSFVATYRASNWTNPLRYAWKFFSIFGYYMCILSWVCIYVVSLFIYYQIICSLREFIIWNRI